MSARLSRRQLLRYGAATAAVVPFAGACTTESIAGSGTPAGSAPSSSPTAPPTGPTGTSPSPSPTPAPPEPIEVWLQDINRTYRAGTEDRIGGFPGPKVQSSWVGFDTLRPKYQVAEAAGTAPDVIENEVDLSLIKLSDMVAVDDVVAPVRGDFLSGTIGSETVGNTLYGVPTRCSAYVLFYSKSALRKAKVDVPGTLDGLIDATTKLAKGSQKGLYLGKDGGAWMASAFLQAAGLRLVTEQNKVGFASVWAAEALRKLRDLNDSPGLMRGGQDWWDITPLMSGATAMQWSGSWVLPQAKAALGNDLGVAALPRLSSNNRLVVPVGTSSAMVLRASEDDAAAKKLVEWMWVYQRDLVSAIGGDKLTDIPARKNAIGRVPLFASGVGAEIVDLVKKWGVPYGHPAWSAKIDQRLVHAATNVIQGREANREVNAAARAIRPMLADVLNR